MILRVHRDIFTEQSTGGILSVDGSVVGFTLEPPRREPPVKPRAIPAGTYNVIMAFSPKHQRFLPLVENVPDFEGIEIHIGNWPHDTEGCLLVGEKRGEDSVLESTPEFNELYSRIADAARAKEAITITYTEAQQ